MKKAEFEMEDELRPEYDLKSMRVRKLGSGRRSFAGTIVQLDPDVAAMFPNAGAVNEALRFLIKVMQQNQLPNFNEQSNTVLETIDKS